MSFFLEHVRVLDLTDSKGNLCGRILADLGADVIKLESPGGDDSRAVGPFYHDQVQREKSLFWFCYDMNKKSVTLNLETVDGRSQFKRLVGLSDIVIESFRPGYLDGLGIGFESLKKVNPSIILTSISDFGATGPRSGYLGSDLVDCAMSGFLYLCGAPDRPPVRISFEQAYLHASSQAAAATAIAFHHRQATGIGQHVDTSAQQSMMDTLINAVPMWEMNRVVLKRAGAFRVGLSSISQQRQVWPCKDGFVTFMIMGGAMGARTNSELVKWMDSTGEAPDFLKTIDWDKFDMSALTEELNARIEEPIGKFLAKRTKQELQQEGLKRGMQLYMVCDVKDIAGSEQLKARDFWRSVEHPELKEAIIYPGPWVKSDQLKLKYQRAPLMGEHNLPVYCDLLGLSRDEVIMLKEGGAI